MRPFEIAMTATLLPYLLHLLSPSRGESPWFSTFPLLALFFAACHFIVEGYRWQMIPGYCLTILLIAFDSSRCLFAFRASYLVGAAGLILELATIGLSTVMPVFKLPAPTGPLKIGTQIRHLIDETRRDPYYSDYPNGPRELMIQIWYPTESSARGQIAPYIDTRITTFRDAHIALVESHALLDAPLSRSQDRFPLVFYSPSWSGIRTESTFQIEQLASHGYVVVGIDHPYSSYVTVFPNGRLARKKLRVLRTTPRKLDLRHFARPLTNRSSFGPMMQSLCLIPLSGSMPMIRNDCRQGGSILRALVFLASPLAAAQPPKPAG